MKDNVSITDSVSIKVIRHRGKTMNNQIIDAQGIVGITNFYLIKHTGETIHFVKNRKNTIVDLFKDRVVNGMDQTSGGVDMTNLFSAGDVIFGSTEDGNDGICCRGTGNVTRTCETITVTATETYGTKWQGDILFQSIPSGDSITNAYLGANFAQDQPDITWASVFADPIANQQFAGQDVENNDRMIFEWEIYLT